MNGVTVTDEATRKRIGDFCRRHRIERIALRLMEGVTAAHRVCDLQLKFAAGDHHVAHVANFKLQGADARIGERVTEIEAGRAIRLADEQVHAPPSFEVIGAFLDSIEKRVRKVRQEQSVQSMTFLGNRFRLHGTTTFLVVSDDDGLLGIEIEGRDGRKSAQMIASSVLDGLYDGSIELLPPHKS